MQKSIDTNRENKQIEVKRSEESPIGDAPHEELKTLEGDLLQ